MSNDNPSLFSGQPAIGPDGTLLSIEENLAIARDHTGRIVSGESGAVLAADTPVSMNLWGLRPSIFEELQTGWERFHRDAAGDPAAVPGAPRRDADQAAHQ